MRIKNMLKFAGFCIVLMIGFSAVSCSEKKGLETESVEYTIEPYRKDFSFNFGAGSLRSMVVTNAPLWMAEDNYSWITTEIVDAEDGKVLQVSVEENDSDEQRKGSFDLIGTDQTGKELVRTSIAVIQNPKSGMVDGAIMFEDPIFEGLLLQDFDLNEDKVITVDEIENVTQLDLENLGISSVEGIRYFKNLTHLDVNQNNLKKLDVSGLTKLESVFFNINKVNTFKCDNCPKLQSIMGRSNKLKTVELSPVKEELLVLDLMQNELTSLDLSGMSKLRYAALGKNAMTSLKLDGCVKLEAFSCQENNLSSLNLKDAVSLLSLDCSNNSLQSIDLTNCVKLGELAISGNSRISSLDLKSCPIIHLDVSGTTLSALEIKEPENVQTIKVSDTNIKKLDLISYIDLRTLYCSGLTLDGLDMTKNVLLENFVCVDSGLKTLDMSANTKLKNIDVCKNLLTTLDLANSPLLEAVKVRGNVGLTLTLPKALENNSSLKLEKDGDCTLNYR